MTTKWLKCAGFCFFVKTVDKQIDRQPQKNFCTPRLSWAELEKNGLKDTKHGLPLWWEVLLQKFMQRNCRSQRYQTQFYYLILQCPTLNYD